MSHKSVSFIKSGIRILACGFLMFGEYFIAGLLLALAEGLGILEEIV